MQDITHGWHLKKEVTVGQIFSICIVAISGIWWASSVETRMSALTLEDRRIEQKTDILFQNFSDRFAYSQQSIEKAFVKIDKSLDRIESKIDKKVDKP